MAHTNTYSLRQIGCNFPQEDLKIGTSLVLYIVIFYIKIARTFF
jgi:hypothetical protein